MINKYKNIRSNTGAEFGSGSDMPKLKCYTHNVPPTVPKHCHSKLLSYCCTDGNTAFGCDSDKRQNQERFVTFIGEVS